MNNSPLDNTQVKSFCDYYKRPCTIKGGLCSECGERLLDSADSEVDKELETFARAWIKYISVATLAGDRATTRKGTETAIRGYDGVAEDFTASLKQLLASQSNALLTTLDERLPKDEDLKTTAWKPAVAYIINQQRAEIRRIIAEMKGKI